MRTLFTIALVLATWLCALAHGQSLQSKSSVVASLVRVDRFSIAESSSVNAVDDSPLLSVSVRVLGVSGASRTYGSGTVVQSDPCLILTANHVATSATSFSVEWTDGTRLMAKFLFGDQRSDLAVLHCPEASGRPAVAISESLPKASDQTWTIGGSRGAELTQNTGRVIRSGKSNLESTAVAVEGRSGGGVFDSGGYLIGVISARDPSNGNATIATACSSIWDLFKRNRDRCPDGKCPSPQNPNPSPQAPAPTPQVPGNILGKLKEFEELKSRVKQLEDALANLKLSEGKDGADGRDGRDGIDGKPGRDADIQVAINWFKANAELFKGKDGKAGDPGLNGKDGAVGPPGVITIRVVWDDGRVIKEIKDAASGGVVTVSASKLFSEK